MQNNLTSVFPVQGETEAVKLEDTVSSDSIESEPECNKLNNVF